MGFYNINPLHEFDWELECIKNSLEYEIAVKALIKLPDYFWVCSASSSGKYHPKSSLGIGGLVRHTKSAFRISEELLNHPLFAPFDNKTKDQVRVAILLHDGFKQGIQNKGRHTILEHPLLIRENAKPWDDDAKVSKEMKESWNTICNFVESHMGVWNTDKQGNEVLRIPKTKPELFVHLCDYLASKKSISVDIYEYKPQNSKSQDWRQEPATEYISNGEKKGQIPYICKLYNKCQVRGIQDLPIIKIKNEKGEIILTKGEATDIIQDLKRRLGE